MTLPDNVLEDEPDDRPRDVVDRRCGGDEPGAGEDDGPVDVADPGVGPLEGDEPRDQGGDDADEEEESEPVVK